MLGEARDLKGLQVLNKVLLQNKMKKVDNPIFFKWTKDLNRHPIKGAVQMAINP